MVEEAKQRSGRQVGAWTMQLRPHPLAIRSSLVSEGVEDGAVAHHGAAAWLAMH